MTKLFTRENAAEMARRSNAAKKARKAEELARAAMTPQDTTEDARTKRVLLQIEQCDKMIERCRDFDEFSKLTAAKERLWNLIFPKAGVMRPRNQRSAARAWNPVMPIGEAGDAV
jgi:hypothetical protein